MPTLLRLTAKALGIIALVLLLVLGASALWVNRHVAGAERAYPASGRVLTLEGARVHHVEVGAPSADRTVVVLIHGNPGSVRDFEPLIPALAASRRVIAVDRPGHGYSERPEIDVASPGAQARRLHALLGELGVHRPILVGHSWGGAIALAYALDFPADVGGLVLLGTRAYPVDGPPDPLYALLRRPVVGPLLRNTLVPIFGRRTLDARFTAAYLPDSVQPEHLESARALWLRPGQLGATVWDTFLLQRDAPSMARRYSSIAIPVMILVGDGDSLLPESRQLSTQLPNAWIEVLPNTGHYLPRTHVAEIQRAIAVLEARMSAPSVPAPARPR
jgi:pimeloyl-ACP methyl ester carboxylesterase